MYVCMYVCMLHFYSTICLKGFLIRIVGASDRITYVQSTHVKRCVFSFFLKLTTLSVFRTISGRLFHTVSDAQVNECEANTDVIPLGLDNNLCPSERRRRVGTYSGTWGLNH